MKKGTGPECFSLKISGLHWNYSMNEVNPDRNDGKACRNTDRIYITDRFDQRRVAGVVDAQGLERRPEAVPQVETDYNHTNNIEQDVKRVVEGFNHRQEKVLHRMCIGFHFGGRQNTHFHLEPELPQVQDQENKNDNAEPRHVAGAALFGTDMGNRITRISPRGFVVEPQTNSLKRMPQNKSVQRVGDRFDQRIVRHEKRVGVEGFSTIVLQ